MRIIKLSTISLRSLIKCARVPFSTDRKKLKQGALTDWHYTWQHFLPQDQVEVRVQKPLKRNLNSTKFSLKVPHHRADARRACDGLVVEFQHSTISVEQIQARENCYKNMIWVFDCENFPAVFFGEYVAVQFHNCHRYPSSPMYLDTGLVLVEPQCCVIDKNGNRWAWGRALEYMKFIKDFLPHINDLTDIPQKFKRRWQPNKDLEVKMWSDMLALCGNTQPYLGACRSLSMRWNSTEKFWWIPKEDWEKKPNSTPFMFSMFLRL